jgi:3-oxoacyl-[acyl-carrier-protein] synthase II
LSKRLVFDILYGDLKYFIEGGSVAKKRVVVTGMGLVSCFGTDVDHFYEQLLEGKSGIVPIEGFPCSDWPTRIGGVIRNFDTGDYMEKKQARRVDPFIRYAMVAGKKALEHACLGKDELDKLDLSRAGIIVGSGMGGMQAFYDGVDVVLNKGYKRLTPFFVPYIITNMAGALLAIDLGFRGPNFSISTACATSNNCIHTAREQIVQGKADIMLCGGTEAAITPIGLAGFVAIKALSSCNDQPEKASKPWDQARDGFVMGEGAGILVLEDLEHALKRGAPIYAELLGSAVNCDAYHMTDPRSDGLGVAECIEEALKTAGIGKESIDYINAHATSTPVGDICEVGAIHKVFGPHTANIKMNGTKSMIGHCLGAAGGLEAIATVQAIRTGWLHPTINLENPEPLLGDLDPVAGVKKKHQISAAISNSFGFGGHNSTLVFAPYNAS